MRCTAVFDAERHRMADRIWIGWRLEGDCRLVGGGSAACHEQKPRALKSQYGRGAAVLTYRVRPEDVDLKPASTLEIRHDEYVGDFHPCSREQIVHLRSQYLLRMRPGRIDLRVVGATTGGSLAGRAVSSLNVTPPPTRSPTRRRHGKSHGTIAEIMSLVGRSITRSYR